MSDPEAVAAVAAWFLDWLKYAEGVLGLRSARSWVRSDDPEALEHYEGWIEEFARVGATRDLADRAARHVQVHRPRYNGELPKAIADAIVALRGRDAAAPGGARSDAPHPELVKTSVASHECPECGGAGWAHRMLLLDLPAGPRAFRVQLFCRCPAGRWRRIHDPDRLAGRPRNFDDLQARPELWNPHYRFSLWSPTPTTPDVSVEPGGPPWRYLRPDEPAPAPGRAGDLAGRLARRRPPPAKSPQPSRAELLRLWAESDSPILRREAEAAGYGKAAGVPVARPAEGASEDEASRPGEASEAKPVPPWVDDDVF